MKRRLLLIALFALATLSPLPIRVWRVNESFQIIDTYDYSSGQPILNSLSEFHFGSINDCFMTGKNSIKIVDCQNRVKDIKWQSAVTWKVTEAISADLNRDGHNELVMVVWRPHKPWPIDSFLPSGGRISDFHDRQGSSCHLILVGWDGTHYRELWAGSSLVDPIFGIRAADLDHDGNQELVALEGKYDAQNITGNLTAWDWSGFGFRLRTRLEGKFSEFGIISEDQNVMIMSD